MPETEADKVVEIPYTPRDVQLYLHNNLLRFNVIVAHRRLGKTVFTINELIKCAMTGINIAPRFAYIAPLYRQAKAVAWDFLKYYTSTIPDTKYNESELRVDLPNDARISLYGADNPDSLRGLGLDGVVLDEVAQMKPKLWSEVIRPTLSDRLGWAIFIGTPAGIDDFFELYKDAKDKPDWLRKKYPASQTGILSKEELAAARQTMSASAYAREYEVDFGAHDELGFDIRWLQYWKADKTHGMNKYILVDPANEKKANSDYTAMIVVGIGEDNNYYIIDILRDRLNLTERTASLFDLHRKYKPLGVAYEKYGKDSDIQHIEYVMEQENYRFKITPTAGNAKKVDRIKTLIPDFENGRVFLPFNILKRTGEGYMQDLVKDFIYEYRSFPVGKHDDMLDCLARINDPNLKIKSPANRVRNRPRRAITNYNPLGGSNKKNKIERDDYMNREFKRALIGG